MNYGSAFVTFGNEIEWKGVQFPGRDSPDESANRQSPPMGGRLQSAVASDTSKIFGFAPGEHQD